MFADNQKRRVAMLGLMLESNSFAPVTTKDDSLTGFMLSVTSFWPS